MGDWLSVRGTGQLALLRLNGDRAACAVPLASERMQAEQRELPGVSERMQAEQRKLPGVSERMKAEQRKLPGVSNPR